MWSEEHGQVVNSVLRRPPGAQVQQALDPALPFEGQESGGRYGCSQGAPCFDIAVLSLAHSWTLLQHSCRGCSGLAYLEVDFLKLVATTCLDCTFVT